MKFLHFILIYIPLFIFSGTAMMGQEVLKSARIEARANRKHLPSLGIPERPHNDADWVIWYKNKIWNEADSLKATPIWQMTVIGKEDLSTVTFPENVMSLFKDWLIEKPEAPLFIVWGPLGDSRYIAVCKKSKGDLNWKSIGFIYPK